MDNTVSLYGLLAGLAHLRCNALLALETSSGVAVSQADINHLDAIAAGAFGLPLELVEFTPLGSAPSPEGATMAALQDRLGSGAEEARAFLVDLHQRTHAWLTS